MLPGNVGELEGVRALDVDGDDERVLGKRSRALREDLGKVLRSVSAPRLPSTADRTHLDQPNTLDIRVELRQVARHLLRSRLANARVLEEEVVSDVGTFHQSWVEDGELANPCALEVSSPKAGKEPSWTHLVGRGSSRSKQR